MPYIGQPKKSFTNHRIDDEYMDRLLDWETLLCRCYYNQPIGFCGRLMRRHQLRPLHYPTSDASG